jgi:hypothetical protein
MLLPGSVGIEQPRASMLPARTWHGCLRDRHVGAAVTIEARQDHVTTPSLREVQRTSNAAANSSQHADQRNAGFANSLLLRNRHPGTNQCFAAARCVSSISLALVCPAVLIEIEPVGQIPPGLSGPAVPNGRAEHRETPPLRWRGRRSPPDETPHRAGLIAADLHARASQSAGSATAAAPDKQQLIPIRYWSTGTARCL